MKHDNNGNSVNLLHFKQVFCEKKEPMKIFFKCDFGQEDRLYFDLTKVRRRTKKTVAGTTSLKALYDKERPITKAKQTDLYNLCTQGMIPNGYHLFYKLLSANKEIRDSLPEPAEGETDPSLDDDVQATN